MKRKLIMSAKEAIAMVRDGDVLATGGFIGSGLAETLNIEIEKKFLETGHPRNLTLVYTAGQGSKEGQGNEHYSHAGMVKRVIGGHWGKCPKMGKLANENKIEAYNFPQGVISQMYRDIAIQRGFTISHVGLGTFVDPRLDGGKLNEVTKEELVKVVEIEGKELLLYKHVPIDVCLIRATFADERGNVSFDHEPFHLDATSLAQACKASGGKVLVQVKQVVKAGTIDPRMVKIPGIYVDALVVSKPEEHEQSIGVYFDSSVSGETNAYVAKVSKGDLNSKKIIARRAAFELQKDAVINLGIGTPEVIADVAVEENIEEDFTLTIESGIVGGIALGGHQFGVARNPEAIMDHRLQFDFYDGGGLDMAFLGLAEVDAKGNVNVSKFGMLIAGAGGFINITQNAKKVCYCGTFMASGSKKKFVKKVQQITFSGTNAKKAKQPVLFITERAVFRLEEDGVHLIEIAPGMDIERDILLHMDFKPIIDESLCEMDERIFLDRPMGLKLK
ncbi:MAG: 3-oxoacid CoA-transferase [Lachnospiraceae bacterium]|nr:3-oxoacid CoA-transferase [Lachnospiraceae bacterium]